MFIVRQNSIKKLVSNNQNFYRSLIKNALIYYFPPTGKKKEARESIKWIYSTRKSAEAAWRDLTESTNMKESSSSSGLQELWSIHNLEPILISFCLIGLRQATGVIAFIANAVYFFEDSGIAISPSHATIFIGIINIIVPIIAGEIHKNFSRRATLGVSSMFVINLQIFIAMYLYFQESDGPFKEYTSNPTVLISLVIMYIVAFGVGPDPNFPSCILAKGCHRTFEASGLRWELLSTNLQFCSQHFYLQNFLPILDII